VRSATSTRAPPPSPTARLPTSSCGSARTAPAVDTCALDLSAHRDAGTSDEAQFDLFNTLADGAVFTASATLTADSTLTSTARLSVRPSADLTGDSSLTAGMWQSAHTAASLTAVTDLTADADSGHIPEVADMAAGDWNLYIEQGATFVQHFDITDEGFTWAGWSARSQIRSAPADHGDVLLDLNSYLTVSGARVTLAIPATQTQTLTRNGVWDLEMVQGSTVVRILNGRAIVSPEVTR
jgi:hypothetical protein